MKKLLLPVFAATMLLLTLSGCKDADVTEGAVPVAMTEHAVGHYCQMYVLDHGGPKAQIHLQGQAEPLWFAQVSDAIAYLNDLERTADVAAVFVSDMANAPSWSEPGVENWIDGRTAFYVTSSKQMGGMGTPEAIPFGSRLAAAEFTDKEGGVVLSLDEVPDAYVRPKAGVGMDDAPNTHENIKGS